MKKKRTKKQLKKLYILLFCALFVLLYGASVISDYCGSFGGDTREVTITAGSGTKEIAATLQKNGIIKKPLWFRVFSKLGGHDGAYQQGTYVLQENAGYNELYKTLKHAPERESVKITIPEGFELRQIADRLEEAGLIDRKRFYDAVENGNFAYDFVKKIPKRENRLEGYLFPDTYMFQPGESEESIINKMLSRFNEVYTDAYRSRARELGMTDDQVITLATVIEREAMGDADRRLVASVFHNRLKSKSYPYLQSCATVQYILKERKTVLSVKDTQIDSPYNTYKYPGLPIGPIASPGKEAIEAALYPEQTDYLFFVLDSKGVHRFARTFEEHQANMRK